MTSDDERLSFRRSRSDPRRMAPVFVLVGLILVVLIGRVVWPTSTPQGVLIEVVGEVPAPGWHRIDPPTLKQALRAAGSSHQGSAATLHEGDRVVVEPDGVRLHPSGDPLLVAIPVDLNLADAETLRAVPGLGDESARAILEDRLRRGPFYAVDDLTRVSGIGAETVASIRAMVTVGEIGPRPKPGRLDLNRASASQLERLPGIGPVTAARIVVDRDENGPYDQVEDVMRVRGVGRKILAKIRPHVLVSSSPSGQPLSASPPEGVDAARAPR
ncbi:MAG: hypothetical protein EA397_13450 [Deltaproteobacteria bacterium]|nr:MAG: hypothetical protein EA397_13450 [Deltaproteobacteria bacterium]